MGRAIAILRGMLMRGFTTVRDVGGADQGLRLAAGRGTSSLRAWSFPARP